MVEDDIFLLTDKADERLPCVARHTIDNSIQRTVFVEIETCVDEFKFFILTPWENLEIQRKASYFRILQNGI